MTTPDVTVVVAVYNTMPYLVQCLDSLVEQSIGAERLEVVAVDDGSTDDSGKVLDEYAAERPEIFRVIHQENSGGPASPSNRALEVATGRYVYFLGSDDYLGTEALERMVAFADEHESDVVVGKMVGVNGRGVHQGLFRDGNVVDLDPYGPKLRWAIANTKLFRRDFVEGLGLRYREDMPFGSDQPYTLTACVHAKRISVLADYTCYYAVQREDRSNISYKTPYDDRVWNIEQMMQTVADLVPPGQNRDTILTRHFAWEVPRLLQRDLVHTSEPAQHAVCAGVRRMADAWLSDAMLDELPVWARLRVVAAARDDLPLLHELVDRDVVHADLIHLEDGQALAVLPGFRAGDLTDRLYRMAPPGVSGRLSDLATLGEVRISGDRLRVDLCLPIVGPDAESALSARLDPLDAAGRVLPPQEGLPGLPARVDASVDAEGARAAVTVDLGLLASTSAPTGTTAWQLVLQGEIEAGGFDVRLPSPGDDVSGRFWLRGRPYRVRVTPARRGRGLEISIESYAAREVGSAVLRRLRR
jgi:hypothetical protein